MCLLKMFECMLLSTNLTLPKNNSVMNLFLKEWGKNTAQQNFEFDSILLGWCNYKKKIIWQARILDSKAWWVNVPEGSILLLTWSLETTPESPNFYRDSENTIIFQSHEECFSIQTLHLLALPSQKQSIWWSNYERLQTSTTLRMAPLG